MGASAGLMMAGSSMASSISAAESSRAQGNYQRVQGQMTARMYEGKAEDAISRGREEANVSRRKTKALAGSQKATMAAQGLDVSDGSAAETIEQTRTVGVVEELNIKTNAWREAWGYKQAGLNAEAEGDFANIAARGEARQTLIAGGMQAVSYGASGYRANGVNRTTPTRERSFAGNPQRATNRVD